MTKQQRISSRNPVPGPEGQQTLTYSFLCGAQALKQVINVAVEVIGIITHPEGVDVRLHAAQIRPQGHSSSRSAAPAGLHLIQPLTGKPVLA